MGNSIQRALQDFEKYISNINTDNPAQFKKIAFHKIDKIAREIANSPDKENLKNHFFNICSKLDKSRMHKRARSKPLGYAGDYLIIDWIYTQKTAKSGVGKFYDQLFHNYKATRSVRNRKDYFIEKCVELAKSRDTRIDVLSLGCGSCRDVLDTYSTLNDGCHLHFHCVDHEEEAIIYAKKLLAHCDVQKNVTLDRSNVFHIKSERKYDLIWSAGLFDYLKDGLAIQLLKRTWNMLKEDGQLIFGNFGPKNTERHGMELVMQWNLIHRDMHELVNLCQKAGIQFKELEIESEPLGINLFCIIKK